MYYRLIGHSFLVAKSLRENTIQITFNPYSKALAYFSLLLFYECCNDIIGPKSDTQSSLAITIQNVVEIDFLTPSHSVKSFFLFSLAALRKSDQFSGDFAHWSLISEICKPPSVQNIKPAYLLGSYIKYWDSFLRENNNNTLLVRTGGKNTKKNLINFHLMCDEGSMLSITPLTPLTL